MFQTCIGARECPSSLLLEQPDSPFLASSLFVKSLFSIQSRQAVAFVLATRHPSSLLGCRALLNLKLCFHMCWAIVRYQPALIAAQRLGPAHLVPHGLSYDYFVSSFGVGVAEHRGTFTRACCASRFSWLGPQTKRLCKILVLHTPLAVVRASAVDKCRWHSWLMPCLHIMQLVNTGVNSITRFGRQPCKSCAQCMKPTQMAGLEPSYAAAETQVACQSLCLQSQVSNLCCC